MILNRLKRAATAPVVPGYEGMKEREARIVAMDRVLLRRAAGSGKALPVKLVVTMP